MSQDDDRPPRPPLTVVAQNDDRAIRLEGVKQALEADLRALAANVMRVARGAGKAYEIGRQCKAVAGRFEEYRSVAGHYPPTHEIDAAIAIRREIPSAASDREYERSRGIDTVMRGALQAAASHLVGQRTQEAAGETQLLEGVRILEKLREENRREAVSRKEREDAFEKWKSERDRKK
ncbi:hypothetical protein [Aquabacter cavernae]|uniref:hypothetical protein n=1 Tax=Aquabacter cavernae TaxID=2496029 RepID=UPI000F8D79AC|nr:hypothetical protein [Aquabacter cavernae]